MAATPDGSCSLVNLWKRVHCANCGGSAVCAPRRRDIIAALQHLRLLYVVFRISWR
jgi:hypothetical protein